MEWQQIIGFYHVAVLGSFTRAGEATFRTQSALSQQISALEGELGCRFFERIGTRKLKLTPAGERFFEFAKSVLHGEERLRADLSDFRSVQCGPLRIAAPFTTLYHLFPHKLKLYMQRFPGVDLTLLDRPQGIVVDLVRNGDVDLGVAAESIVPKGLSAIRWKRVETVLMVPENHPLARVGRVTWKQLAGYPLILPPREQRHAARMTLESRMQTMKLDYRIVMESSNVELSSLYVEAGLGISLATVVRDLPALRERRIEFLPLDHYFEADHVVLVLRKDWVEAPYKRHFLNVLLGEPLVDEP
jgi:DNA-binding transcriptional LysR family regulator